MICETSDGIDEVQAQVMRSVGPSNPIISCEDIPQPLITVWKTEIPLLTVEETEVPVVDWLSFKTEVNSTINDIVSTIMAKKPLPGSLPADWLAFQKDINNTFTDLKNKFSMLHPKLVTNVTSTRNLTSEPGVFDWASVKDEVNKTVLDIMDSINANKPLPGSLPADWLAFRKKINDSLLDIRKKFMVIHPKVKLSKSSSANMEQASDISTIDWTEIKNSINSTITDIVNSINASKILPDSTPAAWFSFKKKINDTFAGIKNEFKDFHATPTPVEKLDGDGDTPFDSLAFKDQLNKTLNDIIASTVAKKPPPGSTPADWLAFQKELNSTFAQFVNQFSGLHPKPIDDKKVKLKEGESSIEPNEIQNDTASNVNKTIQEIVAEITANKPVPGSTQEEWDAYKQKMSTAFASMQSKYAYLYPKNTNNGSVKLKKSTEPTQQPDIPLIKLMAASKTTGTLREPIADKTFDTVAFRENFNKSLSDLVSTIKTKKPTIDSPMADWAAYKQEIKASVSKIKDQFAGFKTKVLLDPNFIEYAADGNTTFDWAEWKIRINKTIDGLLDDIKTIPPGDPKWTVFSDYLNKTFTDLRKLTAAMQFKPVQVKLMAIMKEDWINFKDRINSTIEDVLDDINSNKPPPGDPSWINYNIYMNNRYNEMREELKTIKTEWLEKVKVATEMMTVVDTEIPAASSASSFEIKLYSNSYNLVIGVICITAAFLMN